jgi:ATP-binding protein involved in chromosome partitioning
VETSLVGLKRVGAALRFTWSDELVAEVGIRDLRIECPCAHCVSEVTGKRLLDPASVPEDLDLKDMQPVGRYAYRCLYSDEHDSGIYPLELLRLLCEEAARGGRARQ